MSASEVFPVLITTDVARAVGFYVELLGAHEIYRFPPDGVDPVYVALRLGASSLGIGVDAESTPGAAHLWVYVDDCDATVERMRQAGVAIVAEPMDQPWGERVGRVLDPDGTVVDLGERRG